MRLRRPGGRRRGQVWWIRCYVGRKLVEESLRTKKKDEAIRALKELNGREVRGGLLSPTRTPVEAFLRDYSERLRTRHSGKSWRTDMGRLKRFFARALVKTLEEVTPPLVSLVLDHGLRDGWSPGTCNNCRRMGHEGASDALLDRYATPRMLRLHETDAAAQELVSGTGPGQATQPAVPTRRVG